MTEMFHTSIKLLCTQIVLKKKISRSGGAVKQTDSVRVYESVFLDLDLAAHLRWLLFVFVYVQ